MYRLTLKKCMKINLFKMKWSVGGQSYPFMIVMSIFGLRIKKPYPSEKYSPAVAKISQVKL
jgi:hypothetical protein